MGDLALGAADGVMGKGGADLDPDIRRFVETTGAAYRRYGGEGPLTPQRAREVAERVRAPWREGGPKMARTVDTAIPTRHGEVRARIHHPLDAADQPALLYLHGGGWTFFSIDTHDRLMREYAHRACVVVVGIDYALSPEAKFPVALEQCTDATVWLHQNGVDLGIDPARLAVGGDSAGGNLSVGVGLALRDAGRGDVVRALLLNYPSFGGVCTEEYVRRYGGPGYMLSADEIATFWDNLVRDAADRGHPHLRSLDADLAGLPPVFIAIPECDILSCQSLAMVPKLEAASVPVRAELYRGATHSFLEAVSISRLADRALADGSAWLREILAAPR